MCVCVSLALRPSAHVCEGVCVCVSLSAPLLMVCEGVCVCVSLALRPSAHVCEGVCVCVCVSLRPSAHGM